MIQLALSLTWFIMKLTIGELINILVLVSGQVRIKKISKTGKGITYDS